MWDQSIVVQNASLHNKVNYHFYFHALRRQPDFLLRERRVLVPLCWVLKLRNHVKFELGVNFGPYVKDIVKAVLQRSRRIKNMVNVFERE